MYIYICICIYTCSYIFTCIYIHTFIHSLFTCACIYMYSCMYSHAYMHTHVNEQCHTNKWVMSNIWMRRVTLWMSHVTHMNESWVTSHKWTWIPAGGKTEADAPRQASCWSLRCVAAANDFSTSALCVSVCVCVCVCECVCNRESDSVCVTRVWICMYKHIYIYKHTCLYIIYA